MQTSLHKVLGQHTVTHRSQFPLQPIRSGPQRVNESRRHPSSSPHTSLCSANDASSSNASDRKEVVHDGASTIGFKGGLRAVQNGTLGATAEERVKRQQARKLEDAWLNGKGTLGMVLMANRAVVADDKAGLGPGDLLPTIMRWPSKYTFNAVIKPQPGVPNDALVDRLCGCIGQICGQEVSRDQCRVTDRMKGKFLSVAVTLVVQSPEVVSEVYDALAKDDMVKMWF